MKLVILVSGGLDSTLVHVLAKEEKIRTWPLFIDYGQRARRREWNACLRVHKRLRLPKPVRLDVSDFGKLIESGLTSSKKSLKADAFTPCRNLLFLTLGASYAYQCGAEGVAIGLLSEALSLFPDQRALFTIASERAIESALGSRVKVIAPLMNFTKRDVIGLAASKNITGTYSCHKGLAEPCGKCIACLEFE